MKHKTSPLSEKQHEPQQASVAQDHYKQSNYSVKHNTPGQNCTSKPKHVKKSLKMRGGRSVWYFE